MFDETRRDLTKYHEALLTQLESANPQDTKRIRTILDVGNSALEALDSYELGDSPRDRWLRGEPPLLVGLTGAILKMAPKLNYMYVCPTPNPRKMPWFPFQRRCYNEVCEREFTRIRWTCVRRCLSVRVWIGDCPPVFRIKRFPLFSKVNRPRWKRFLTKKVMSVVEWLML